MSETGIPERTFYGLIHYTYQGQKCTDTMALRGSSVYAMTSQFEDKFLTEHDDGCVIQRIEVKEISL